MSYDEKVAQELRIYRDVANVHDLPPIYHYWSDKYLRPKCETLGFVSPDDFYVRYIKQAARSAGPRACRVLSLGAGNCDTEVRLAAQLREQSTSNFHFDCFDINGEMLARGRQLAAEQNLSAAFSFIETDLNRWSPAEPYDIIIANQSLHHFVELELLFAKTHAALRENGFFLTNDMIGRNGHQRWPEALELVHALWSVLDPKHKWNHQLARYEEVYENWDCSTDGFEGIRSQDILPLLLQTFGFDSFLGFCNLINIFIDRGFGHNFDIEEPKDRYFIDFVAQLDEHFLLSGKIKPTQMIAAMTKDRATTPAVYKHLTPQFCLRDPSR
jgi:SAM-dependent methyltransferase